MLSTGTPLADMTDTKVCLSSRGAQSSAFIERARPVGRAVQPFAQSVVYGLAHRVGARGPDSRVQFLVQRLELGSDLLLGLAGDLPPDPLPAGAVPERDRTLYRFLAASR
jgi:hypothetical protein